MLKNKERVNVGGEDSCLFYQGPAKCGPRIHLGVETLAGGKLLRMDASGMDVLGGTRARVGWHPSGRRLVRAWTGKVGGHSWKPRA